MKPRRFNHVGSNNLTLAVLDDRIAEAGLARGASFHGQDPFVGFVPAPTGIEVGGRFFPSRNAVLVFACGDAGIERATLNHELTHHARYRVECKGTAPSHRNGCAYSGQHGPSFYVDLEHTHRATGVTPAQARIVEGGSPSSGYPFPDRWMHDDAW